MSALIKRHMFILFFDLQLHAQNYYLFTYNIFIKVLSMFRALPCSSSGDVRRNCIHAASGIVTVCRWLSCAPVKKELKKIKQGYTTMHGQPIIKTCLFVSKHKKSFVDFVLKGI
jgi:hypothetical protein